MEDQAEVDALQIRNSGDDVMIAPCKDCEKRHFKCHAECEDYKAFVEECRERRAKRKKEADFVCYLVNKQAKKERAMKRKSGSRRKVH